MNSLPLLNTENLAITYVVLLKRFPDFFILNSSIMFFVPYPLWKLYLVLFVIIFHFCHNYILLNSYQYLVILIQLISQQITHVKLFTTCILFFIYQVPSSYSSLDFKLILTKPLTIKNTIMGQKFLALNNSLQNKLFLSRNLFTSSYAYFHPSSVSRHSTLLHIQYLYQMFNLMLSKQVITKRILLQHLVLLFWLLKVFLYHFCTCSPQLWQWEFWNPSATQHF